MTWECYQSCDVGFATGDRWLGGLHMATLWGKMCWLLELKRNMCQYVAADCSLDFLASHNQSQKTFPDVSFHFCDAEAWSSCWAIQTLEGTVCPSEAGLGKYKSMSGVQEISPPILSNPIVPNCKLIDWSNGIKLMSAVSDLVDNFF